jgi:O-antigen ligase
MLMVDLLSTARLERYSGILWGLLLFTLPITSFRYLPSFFGSTTVSPLALYPLAFLFPMLLILAWRARRVQIPRISAPLLAFLLVALAATLTGFLYAPLNLRGQSFTGRAMRAWFSVAVGLTFFLSAFWMNRSHGDLKRSLKWLYAGLVATIIWGAVQILAFNTTILDEALVENIQRGFSVRGLSNNNRISAFAFEPSWLADQIVIFYFPWLFSAVLSGYRLTRHRWLEPLLLIFATVLLMFTFSRGGVLIALIVSAVVVLITGHTWLGGLWGWMLSPLQNTSSSMQSRSLTGLLRIALLVVILVSLAGAGFVFSQNPYFSSFLEYNTAADLYEYVINVSAGSRLAYAVSGLNIFADYPWMGVGLGASNLYLYNYLPDWALTDLPEINRRLSPDSNTLSNTKNLYVRLLSEVGIFGFWFFAAFYLSLLAEVRALFISTKSNLRHIAIAGLFLWLAVALRNFTQDSLTFPIMWVGFGIILGLAQSNRS